MLSKLIVICSLFVYISLGCGSINENGVPQHPLHVCASLRWSISGQITTMYYQFICDRTQTGVLMSAHFESDCSDTSQLEVPWSMKASIGVNCEHIYDCSYALYRFYNDSTNQCQHSSSTPYMELPVIIGHCGYDYSVSASMEYTCDANTIYRNTDLGDTEGKCQDTIQESYISAGCNDITGQYDDVVACDINPTPSPASTPPPGVSTGVIVGIVIAVVIVLTLGILGVVYYYKKNGENKPKPDVPITYIPVNKQEGPIYTTSSQMQQTGHSNHAGHVSQQHQIQQTQQMQQTQQKPPPAYIPQAQQKPAATYIPQQQPIYQVPDTQRIHGSERQPLYETKPIPQQIQNQETQHTEPPPSPPPQPPPQVIISNKYEDEALIQDSKSVIGDWLRQNAELTEMDSNKYAHLLIENGFDDLKSLKDITKEDLADIGIKKLGHKKAIIKAIESDDCMLEPID